MIDNDFDEEDLNYVIYLLKKVLIEKLKDNNYEDVNVYIDDEFVDKYTIEFNVIAASKNIVIDENGFSYKRDESVTNTLKDIMNYIEDFTNSFV